MAAHNAWAQTQDLGDGFKDHGPVADVAESRGMVCTEDGDGNSVVLVWLFDHRYAYALAVIDAQTGEIEEIPRPIENDCPFSSLLASNGRYYTYFGGHFIEFDPRRREFTFVREGPSRAAMSMTEDDSGTVWAAIYPNSDVVSYSPRTGQYRHYGPVYDHPSRQYPRSMAADDHGWVYIGIGLAAGQIIILNPESGQASPVVPAEKVVGKGGVQVYRDLNGRVYGYTPWPDTGRQWYEFYGGQVRKLDEEPDINPKPIVTGSQGLRHRQLPNGERVVKLDLVEGRLIVENPETEETRQLHFNIAGEGGASMGLAAVPGGTLAGGTYIPHRFFSYNPHTDEWTRRACYRQWNTIAGTDDRVYVGTYTEGVLLEWDPAEEWVPTERDNPHSNPRYLAQTRAHPDVGRPYVILAHPDGRHIIMGGSPGYGYTGGGLVFYDREADTAAIVTHEDLILWHSTSALVALPDGRLVGGTTRQPALGGVRKAEVAELYILDMETKQIEWHEPLLEAADRYTDMIVGPDGSVFGVLDRTRLFVFDPVERTILHETDLEETFGPTVFQQGPRVFVQVPDGRIFVLFVSGIAQLDPQTYELTMLAEAPDNLGNGGAYLDGRLYFSGGAHGAHLYSWPIPPAE
ncbi:MAG: hypothetical protein U9R79_13010 [Armatimonadota bacterium]|nr:hypothetical protein [Armatimonadota bacterium]